MNKVPPILSLSFIALVAVLYSLLILGATWANGRAGSNVRWRIYGLRVIAGGFLLISGLLALQGAFLEFSTSPPTVFYAIGPMLAFTLALAFNPLVGRWLQELPQSWLIGAQAFRIIVEIQLFFLAQTPLFPKLMTFEGRNFDILAGLSAPVVAWYVQKQERQGRLQQVKRAAVVWNLFGLALLINVAMNGILSAPTQFQSIFSEPANTAIGYFPFIWLPSFVVPFAFLLHILSLRKAFQSPHSRPGTI